MYIAHRHGTCCNHFGKTDWPYLLNEHSPIFVVIPFLGLHKRETLAYREQKTRTSTFISSLVTRVSLWNNPMTPSEDWQNKLIIFT